MERVTLDIKGMSCGHCVGAVSKALGAVPGVEVEDVHIGSATVRFDPATVTRAQLGAAVAAEGYTVASG